ncbi:MAG TPA: gliding motility-associated C-terminal domain-containing protein, partial [Sphingobacteriaceae bacterium]
PEEDVRIDIITTSDPLVRIGSHAAVVIQDIVPDDPLTDDPVPENKDLFPDPTVSPNDDGQGNDYFNIGNILSFPENEVMIFNRWGNVVFRVKGYNTTDKIFRGFANTGIGTHAPEPLVDGVYYYVIYTYKTIGPAKERRLNKGYLILKR